MASPADTSIRAALKSVIETAAPLAVVFDWWVLGANEDQWPGYLRSSSDLDANGQKRVHGYVITRIGADPNEGRATRRNSASVRRMFQYSILALRYYDSSSTSASNSDVTFNAELDAISDALDDLTSVSATLSRAEPIAWAVNLKPYGGELLHIARGVISVPSCT